MELGKRKITIRPRHSLQQKQYVPYTLVRLCRAQCLFLEIRGSLGSLRATWDEGFVSISSELLNAQIEIVRS